MIYCFILKLSQAKKAGSFSRYEFRLNPPPYQKCLNPPPSPLIVMNFWLQLSVPTYFCSTHLTYVPNFINICESITWWNFYQCAHNISSWIIFVQVKWSFCYDTSPSWPFTGLGENLFVQIIILILKCQDWNSSMTIQISQQ